MRLAVALVVMVSHAAVAGALAIDQEPVVLGRTEAVRLSFMIDEAPGTEERPLQLRANVGSFGEVRREGKGRYVAIYVPPPTRFPQVALIAAWRETGPEAPIEFFRVPLHGVTKVSVKAKAGSELTVSLGKDSSAPVTASAKGEATVTLVVPPGVTSADLSVREPSGLVTQRRLPIDVPPYNRLTAALVPRAVSVDGRSWVRLDVFYDPGGADVPATRIKVSPSLGAVALLGAKEGRYSYRYVAPEGAKDAVRFAVSVQGDAASTAQVTVSLAPPVATRLVVIPPPVKLRADGASTAKVQLLATDETGLGVSGQRLALTANGEPLELVEIGAGVYEATWRAPTRYPPGGQVLFAASVVGGSLAGAASATLEAPATLATLEAEVRPSPAPADGHTEVEVLLRARDAAGLPVAGASLELRAERGRAGEVIEQGPGTYRGTWLPAAGLEGEVELVARDRVGGLEQRVRVPLRRPPALELGVRGGVLHTLGDQVSPRVAVELWRDVLLGSRALGLGLTVGYLWAGQEVVDSTGAVGSQSTAHLVPLTARVGFELVTNGAFSLVVGAGGVLAVGFFSTSLTGERAFGVGGGGLGFLSASTWLGPGRLVVEAGYGWAPVRAGSFTAQAAGLYGELGYRFSL